MHVSMLDHLNMTVGSVEASADWYARVFGFEVVEQGVIRGRPWKILKSGEAMLCIYEHPERAPAGGESSVHSLSHFGVRITDRNAWEQTIDREGLSVRYGGAVRWPKSTSWYVEDPSGWQIEVALWDEGHATFG